MRGTENNVLKFEFTIFTLPKAIDDIIFLIWSLVLAGTSNVFQFSVLPIMHLSLIHI